MKRITVPLAISLFLLAVYGAIEQFKPDLIGRNASQALLTTLLVAFSIALVRAISFVLFDIVFLKRKSREAPALLRVLLNIVLYSVFFTIIYRAVLAETFGGLGFIATSTVVSVIIGLALQDTLGNFFAGLSIHVEQPFHILDAIRIGDIIGRVEAVTWRTTTVRTNNNTVVIFPNSRVARETLEVYRLNNLNRHILLVPGPSTVAPQRVIVPLRDAVADVPNVAREKTPIIRIGGYADSNIVYEVLYWTKDYMWVPDIDAQIRQKVWYIFRRNEIEIPSPIRHVMLEQRQSSITDESGKYDALVESVEIFDPLSPQEKETVARSAVRGVFAPGELILRRGDPGDSMFVIYRGSVEIRLAGDDGKTQRVAQLETGSFFGEMALLTGEPRNADVVALTEVETLEIRKGVLQQLLDDNAPLAEALSRKLAERQLELDQRVRAVPEDARRVQSQTLLHRIQRFFGLD